MPQVSLQKDQTIQAILLEELHRLRLKNPAFSLRAFARRLDIQPSALSEILVGKRRVSRKLAERLSDRLLLAPDQKERLLNLLPLKSPSSAALLKDRKTMQLTMDHFRTISEWYHFAILTLAETKGFRSEPAWIASRLRITKTAATTAIARLLRLEMLEKDPSNELRTTGVSYAAPDGVSSISLRKAHGNNLDLAKRSLEEDDLEIRDFSSTTMAIDPAKLPEARRRIRKFQKELCAFLESEEKIEVYKICMQLFPLSKNGEDRNA